MLLPGKMNSASKFSHSKVSWYTGLKKVTVLEAASRNMLVC